MNLARGKRRIQTLLVRTTELKPKDHLLNDHSSCDSIDNPAPSSDKCGRNSDLHPIKITDDENRHDFYSSDL